MTNKASLLARVNRRLQQPRRSPIPARYCDVDRMLTAVLRPVTLPAMRVLLGLLFVWFGALKVVGRSPVGEMVSGTLPIADPDLTVAVLGAIEVVLGLGLVTGVAVRVVLPVLAAHLTGTFLTFVMLPEVMFRSHNPLLLTESGEFVAKNLVLIAAILVLIAHTGGSLSVSEAGNRSSATEPGTTPDAAGTQAEPITQPTG